MRFLRILLGILCYVGAVALVAAGTLRWIECDGTIAESQGRAIAIAFVVAAIVLWVVAATAMKSRFVTIGRVIVLIAIFVIGAAVAMNDLSVTSHSRASRTTADIRNIAVAVEAYNTDHNDYPAASNIDELARQLEPAYTHTTPRTDAWGFPLRYEVKGKQFWIGSAGKHGKWEHARLSDYTRGDNRSLDDDIVFSGVDCVRCAR